MILNYLRINEVFGFLVGLATCRKIVQNHGGHIYVASVKGKGATFHIIMPVNDRRK